MMIEDIINTYQSLNQELRMALSTMEKKDSVLRIRAKIIANQKRCPHFDNNYNWAIVDGKCPYCGFNLEGEKNAKSY